MLALFKPLLNGLANFQSLLRFFSRAEPTQVSYGLGGRAKDNVVVVDTPVLFARFLGSIFPAGDNLNV
jgi:hypothetical protein